MIFLTLSPLVGLYVAVVLAAGTSDTVATGTVIGLLVTLAGYMLRELTKGSAGAWRVVQEKNREIHRLRWEVTFWQAKALNYADVAPYRDPTIEELGRV